MTTRTQPPFRADHVGSLLRPPALLAAREQHRSGTLDDEGLRAAEDEAIRDVVAMQEDIGLQSVTDGEFRRTSWHMDFIYALGGVETTDEKIQVHMRNAEGEVDFESAALRVTQPITLRETIFGDAFAYLQQVVTSGTPKLTIPSPSMVHYRGGRAAIDSSVYPDLEGFWDDLTAAYAEEVRRLAAAGCRYLQLDDTSLAYLNDPAQRAQQEAAGSDAEHQHELYIRNLNKALAGRPDSLSVTTCPFSTAPSICSYSARVWPISGARLA